MVRISILFVTVGLSLCACVTADQGGQAQTDALVGSLAGAEAGHQLEDEEKGLLVDAEGGALVGSMVGSYMDEQQQSMEEELAEERHKKEVEVDRMEDDSLKLYLQNEVFFDFDSAELKASGKSILTKVAEHLTQYNQTAVHVIGHTDSAGADEYNLHLSERRASSVATLLNRRGVAASRIRIEGRGETEPRDSGESEAARRKNRRVELYVRPIVEGKEDMAFESPRY